MRKPVKIQTEKHLKEKFQCDDTLSLMSLFCVSNMFYSSLNYSNQSYFPSTKYSTVTRAVAGFRIVPKYPCLS